MPYNGSGVFQRLYTWVNDAASNIKIRADRIDNEMNGFATGLSSAITKDGQTTITANLPMATYRHTNVGDAVNRNEYATFGQVLDGKGSWAASVGGTADVITVSFSPVFSSYVTGMEISFVSTGANTGAVTLNVDSLGAKAVTKNGTTALVAGDIPSGAVVSMRYDGTRFQLLNVYIPPLSDGDKGDITVSSSGTVWAIDANAVTNAKLAQVATQTFKGRTTASTGNVEDLTVAEATAMLNVFDSTLKGLTPASGGGTTKLLRPDGTWKDGAASFISLTNTSSGTSIDITGIPSTVAVIHIIFNFVSTNGTSGLILQIGDSGGIETTGYSSCNETTTFTSGFNLTPTTIAATNARHGRVTLSNVIGETWVCDSTLSDSVNATTANGAGVKSLSATLDRLRLTTQGGANTFDNGSITIIYG